MEMVMTNGFAELSVNEMETIDGGGLGTALLGALGGACTGFLAGGNAGVKLTPVFGSKAFAVCLIGGTIGGACTGFVAGW